MATISMGIGSSHGPLLTLLPEDWDIRADFDRQNPSHPYQGKVYSFDELLELRGCEYFENQNQLENRRAAFERCQVSINALAGHIERSDPDVVIIFGDDHKEWFLDSALPALTIYCGDHLVRRGDDPHVIGGVADKLDYMKKARYGDGARTFPCESRLATHLVEHLIEDEIDVAASLKIPASLDGHPKTMGHAYTFVYQRLINNLSVPVVPVMLNTYFPPNQPTPRRCWEFGQSIARSIESWNADMKVCVIASGGLSHFVIDEDFDQRMVHAMQAGDVETLITAPDSFFQSGTSETKNWIATAGAMSQAGLSMEIVDYVPCYRSEAGTGNAMGFAVWH